MADPKANGGKIPISFPLGDKHIDGAVVKPASFSSFADMVSEAQNMKAPKAFNARLRRLQMHRQVTYYTNGSAAQLSIEDVLKMPIPAARTLATQLDMDESTPGKVIRAGDGIDSAITYELGKPIPTGQGKEPIRELEFLAKTYGDIEDVMAATDQISQAALLISTIAKPLGTSLSQLPSWALNHISVADGFAIVREVLPHFLESPAES
jgi:hypothetical protein